MVIFRYLFVTKLLSFPGLIPIHHCHTRQLSVQGLYKGRGLGGGIYCWATWSIPLIIFTNVPILDDEMLKKDMAFTSRGACPQPTKFLFSPPPPPPPPTHTHTHTHTHTSESGPHSCSRPCCLLPLPWME